MNTLRVKQGSTLSLACTKRDADGVAENLGAWTIQSVIRDHKDVVVAEFDVDAAAAASGQFTLTLNPIDLNPNTYFADIKFSYGTSINYTSTFQIVVVKAVTP